MRAEYYVSPTARPIKECNLSKSRRTKHILLRTPLHPLPPHTLIHFSLTQMYLVEVTAAEPLFLYRVI